VRGTHVYIDRGAGNWRDRGRESEFFEKAIDVSDDEGLSRLASKPLPDMLTLQSVAIRRAMKSACETTAIGPTEVRR
jgi:hypothetical protein